VEWPLRVNITEEDVWAPYDTSRMKGGDVLSWASDNAYEDLRHLRGRDCSDILNDLVQAFIPKAKARKISPDDLDRLCEYFQEDRDQFEYSRQAFTDAATWAWEAAYTPEDKDLEKALEKAVDETLDEYEIPSYWGQVLSADVRGPKDWSPLKSYTRKGLLEQLGERISYQRKENEWDRFIVFDVMSAPAVIDIRSKLRYILNDAGEHLDISDEQFQTDMKDHVVDPVISRMDKNLSKVMEHVDTHWRVDFQKYWKEVLSDKSRAKEVADEILGFLKNHPAEEV